MFHSIHDILISRYLACYKQDGDQRARPSKDLHRTPVRVPVAFAERSLLVVAEVRARRSEAHVGVDHHVDSQRGAKAEEFRRSRWSAPERFTLKAPADHRSGDPSCRPDSVFMLPDADDCPACTSKEAIDFAVPCDVPRQLGRPVGGVPFWCVSVSWATMPEATVEECDHLRAHEDEVAANRDALLDDGVVRSGPQSCSRKKPAKNDLRLRVPALVRPHQRTYGRCSRERIREGRGHD
jgi:hypothetical protein